MLWRVTADIVVAVHAAYVAIVVVGFAAILLGSSARWRWVRNFYFRAAHLAMDSSRHDTETFRTREKSLIVYASLRCLAFTGRA
jgi:hypothetical protein